MYIFELSYSYKFNNNQVCTTKNKLPRITFYYHTNRHPSFTLIAKKTKAHSNLAPTQRSGRVRALILNLELMNIKCIRTFVLATPSSGV